MHHNIYASILVMFLTIYAVRALPLTLIRREIRNPFIQSFLYYVPYVSLSVMTVFRLSFLQQETGSRELSDLWQG